jgi:hypothetical protein
VDKGERRTSRTRPETSGEYFRCEFVQAF